ncbi:MAG TPA: hypothetical protein VN893_09115 [Bryobacteraceae bacterium]|nr:hypothetical protein [Bryobacteraceae bacterium]
MFLTLMVIGLAGLVVMALPALGGHGHGHSSAFHHGAHGGFSLRKLGALFRGTLFNAKSGRPESGSLARRLVRFLPSPRLVFSLLALYGAFGNALVHAGHLRPLVAALVAILPVLLVERLAVTPLWNLAFRFQGQPSSPMEALVLEDAKAVTPFRNGRGVVSVVRDGRLVQFSAHLLQPKDETRVRVGDRLLVEAVDSEREHLTVSVPERKI